MGLRILVVDDEEMQRDILRGFLEKQGFQAITAANGKEAVRLFKDLPLQLVLLDHRMDDLNGDEVLARMKEINPEVRAIMITAFGAVDTAVKVMKLGADDFMEKPIDLEKLLVRIREIEQDLVVKEEARQVVETLDRDNLPLRIIGSGQAMTNLFSMIQRIAPSPWTVLVKGETGTGKELIAKLIHLLSPRSKAPFVEVNCAAIPENLFESELFGHEKGAFTGANARRKGRFELAMATLVKYSFPGNVRELEHVVQRTITLARGSIIGPDDLPVEVHQHSSSKGTLAECLSQVEKQTILQALEKHNWIQTRAAEELGISERVLRYKMAKLQLK